MCQLLGQLSPAMITFVAKGFKISTAMSPIGPLRAILSSLIHALLSLEFTARRSYVSQTARHTPSIRSDQKNHKTIGNPFFEIIQVRAACGAANSGNFSYIFALSSVSI